MTESEEFLAAIAELKTVPCKDPSNVVEIRTSSQPIVVVNETAQHQRDNKGATP